MNTKTMFLQFLRRRVLLSFGLFSAVPMLLAQNADELADEDVYELSPFEINTADDTGYEAQSTMSGTRLNSSVKDVGVTMTILTEKFLEDTALTNTNDILKFTPGGEKETTQLGEGAGASLYWGDQTRFRGIKTENIVRNQFRTNLPSDSYNAGRFEVSRGSNSILFGIGNPAGLVNRYTNDAIFRDDYLYRIRLNDSGGVRQEITANKVVMDDKLAVYVAALHDRDKSWIKPLFQDQDRVYGSVVYKPTDKLTIKVRGEYMDWDRAAVDYGVPMDGVTPYLNAAAAAGQSPIDHAINRNFWVWIVPGTVGSEFKDWGYAGGNTNMMIYDGSGDGYYRNWQNKVIGAYRSVVGTQNVSLPSDFVARDFNIFGQSQMQHFRGYNTQAVVQYKVNNMLDIEYAYNDEYMLYDFVNNWNGPRLQIDTSATLADGVTRNPNVGRYFVANDVNWRLKQDRTLTNHRLTASLVYDFAEKNEKLAWLGSHNAAFMYERSETGHLWDGMQLVNTTPLPGFTQDLWNPFWGPNNGIRFINYVDIDKKIIYGEHNAWKFREEANKLPGVNAQWVPTTGAVGGGRAFTENLDSLLFVLQSRFWDDRIVTTFGWREDRIDSYNGVIVQDTTRPGGVAVLAKNTQQLKDELQSALSPDTLSRGVVFHAYRGSGLFSDLSFYYNTSTSFGSGSFTNSPDNRPSPNNEGETTDYGIKFGMMDGKINGVFTIFESSILNENEVRAINFGDMSQLFQYIGKDEYSNVSQVREIRDLVSKGFEFQVTANLTKNWRLMASVDKYATEYDNIAPVTGRLIEEYRSQWLANPGDLIGTGTGSRTVQAVYDELYYSYLREKAQEGSRSMNERRLKVTVVTSYDFDDGVFKGFGVGTNLVWQDKASTGYALKQIEGGAWVPDASHPFFNDPITYMGAHIRYSRKIWNDKIDWTIQLNVQNIGGIDPYVVRHGATADAPNTPVPVYVARGEPTTYVLTNTFKF